MFIIGTNDWMMPQARPVDTSGEPAWKAKYEAQVEKMVDVLVGRRAHGVLGRPSDR